MSFFNPTPEEEAELQKTREIEELQQSKANEEIEQNKAAIIVENELKAQREQEAHDRYERDHYSTRNDLLGGLIDSIGNGIEKLIRDLHEMRVNAIHEKERREELAKIEADVEKLLTKSKNIAELESRTAATKQLLQKLDYAYQHAKGDTSKERLQISSDIALLAKTQEQCRQIKNKNQEIKFSNQPELKSELKRCFENENVIEIKMSNADMLSKVDSAVDQMKEQQTAATEKMRDLYEKSNDWQKHEQRDTGKYYYKEPAHMFNGTGIPKDSLTGEILQQQIETRNNLIKGIHEAEELKDVLSKIPNEHSHEIKVNKHDDILEKIKEKAEEFAKEFKKKEREQEAYGMSR